MAHSAKTAKSPTTAKTSRPVTLKHLAAALAEVASAIATSFEISLVVEKRRRALDNRGAIARRRLEAIA